MRTVWVIMGLSLMAAGIAAAAEEGLAAHWACDEGRGDVLADRSGNSNTGTIHGAKWVRSGSGYALQFDGNDDYVDCGNGPSLDLTGPLTLQLWAMPTAANRGEPGIAGKFFQSYAITYYGNAFFYISSGGNKASGPTKINAWSHLAATFDGTTMRFYVNGMETSVSRSKYQAVNHGGKFYLGCVVGDPQATDPNLRSTAFFPGLIDDVRVHSRALSQKEILESYNQEAAGKGLAVFDTSCFGKLAFEPFFYPDEDRVVLSVNSRWVLPLPANAEVVVELAAAGGGPALQTQAANVEAPRHEDEVAFSTAGLAPGKYELRGYVRQMEGVFRATRFARSTPGLSWPSEGWLADRLDLRGGWAEYDLDTAAGEHRISVFAARIYDSAGIRCSIDGKDPVDFSLNGTMGGSPEVWAKTKWETVGMWDLPAGRHTLRVECIPAKSQDGKMHAVNTYIDAFALEPATGPARQARDAQRVSFQYPFPAAAAVPAPAQKSVGPLPPLVLPPSYQAVLTPGGGLEITLPGRKFRVESTYSYPHGGFNKLAAGAPDTEVEPGWQIVGKGDALTAGGKFYEVQRTIQRQPTRIVVRDTIRNKSDDVLGIMLSNQINLQGLADVKVTQMTNCTIHAAQGAVSLGLIALDDLYQLQQTTSYADDVAAIRDDHFGLDKGASYTVEWAIYPTATPDYYDFINQVRKDEGLNGHVEGTWTGMSLGRMPTREFIDKYRVRYLSLGTPWYPVDDPQVSIEGIEFERYPQERARVREFFAKVKQTHPDVRVMIHVAHGLYCCNDPEKRFPDSRAMDSNGQQMDYGGGSEDYYANYWSRERFREGWRWWLFYPTPENSFGKAMLAAMAQMMDEMGTTAMWADGFVEGYVRGLYSYDRWDGHSVTIDPQTKLVTRQKTLAPYAALPILRDTIRLISDKGGVLITNGMAGPHSLWKENYLTSNETGGGDARPVGGLHLGRTVTPLGNPSVIQTERDVYRDILGKLDMGALYWWYGEHGLLTHKTLVEHMYPITFESIHAGTVRGRERIVTRQPGVYGWPGDRSLHAVYLYDARGALARHAFVTTVDKAGVRTQVDLGPEQSAAVVKVPVTVTAATPVNVRVVQYDAEGVRLALNGKGPIGVTVGNGAYPVGAGRQRVTLNGKPQTATVKGGSLTVKIDAPGPCELQIIAGP